MYFDQLEAFCVMLETIWKLNVPATRGLLDGMVARPDITDLDGNPSLMAY